MEASDWNGACIGCKCCGIFFSHIDGFSSPEAAVKAWNKRKPIKGL